jgi:hypothetical protein
MLARNLVLYFCAPDLGFLVLRKTELGAWSFPLLCNIELEVKFRFVLYAVELARNLILCRSL